MTLDSEGSMKLIKFLIEIKKRPLLFLGKKSMQRLSYIQMGFIFGYNNARDYDLNTFFEKTKDGNVWTNFQRYLSEKYKISSLDDSELITFCGSDERAFDLFFDELEIFLKENGIEIPEVK